MEGRPSGGVYFTSPLVKRAAEARTAEIGVLFFGSPIPRLMTASPRSRRSRASSFRANVGDSAIALAILLSFIASPRQQFGVAPFACIYANPAKNKIWSEHFSDQI